MRDRKPYWKDHPAYHEHFHLFTLAHESGTWEMFCVDYMPGLDYAGGKHTEFYWNGDFQESFPFTISTQAGYREQLEQFIDFWLDENRG